MIICHLFFCALHLKFNCRNIINYVWKKRYNYVSFLLVIVTYFLLRYNYVIYLFVVVTFFDDVRRITLYFSKFELPTEITLSNGRFLVAFVCNQKMTKKYVIIT